MLPGVYILVIRGGPATLTVGALGERFFPSGYYCYVGSALGPGGLSRVRRHIRCAGSHDASPRWHIDYLLTHPGFSLVQAWCAPTPDRVECSLAAAVPLPPVPRFGSSDCHCTGHLFFSPADPANIIREAFGAVSLRPRCQDCTLPGHGRKPG